MRNIYILLIALIFVSCEEYYVPNIDDVPAVYAFEGYVTNQKGPYRVIVQKSNGYGKTTIVSDAQVAIQCSEGQQYNLTYNSAGYYLTKADAFVGKIGSAYRLKVTTADGKKFLSEYETMPDCPEIEEVNAIYYEKHLLETTDKFSYLDALEKGIRVVNTTNANGYTPYYRYYCKYVLQTMQSYSIPPMTIEMYLYRPYNSYSQLFIANANDYADNRIVENQLCSTKTNILNYSNDSIISGQEYTLKYCGEFVKVEQYSMTEAQYKYWAAINAQLENKNYLFGQTENQPVGNIKCVSDENEIALGYFGASAVTSAIRAFSLTERSKTINVYDIKSFPDTDTIAIYDTRPNFSVQFKN